MQWFRLVLGMSLVFAISGCRTEPAMVGDPNFPTRQAYNVPAKTLLEKVKSAITSPPINLKIESEADGRITTDWQSQPGAVFTAAGLTRHWQERTRYIITIAPTWDDPTNKSTLEVTEETQQRSQENYEWGSQEPVKRPDRAANLSRQIEQALQLSTAK